MKLLERFALVVYALIMILFVALFMMLTWGIVAPGDAVLVIQAVQDQLGIAILLTVAGILLFLYSVSIMFLNTKKPAPTAALIKATEEGTLHITLATLNQLAAKCVKGVAGVKDVRTHTVIEADGATVHVRVAMMPDVMIAEVLAEIQKTVKTNMETVTGLAVKAVPVLVDNSLAAPVKA